MKRSTFLTLVPLGLLLAFGPLGCDDDDPTGPDDAPENHTIERGGVLHMPGLADPTENCFQCHGADLEGDPSTDTPSCYSCHGQEW